MGGSTFCIHGGETPNKLKSFKDMWCINPEWNTPEWFMITTTGLNPGYRSDGVAAFVAPSKFCIHGGSEDAEADNMWCINFKNDTQWSEITTTGAKPSARKWHVAAFDLASSSFCIHGGENTPIPISCS